MLQSEKWSPNVKIWFHANTPCSSRWSAVAKALALWSPPRMLLGSTCGCFRTTPLGAVKVEYGAQWGPQKKAHMHSNHRNTPCFGNSRCAKNQKESLQESDNNKWYKPRVLFLPDTFWKGAATISLTFHQQNCAICRAWPGSCTGTGTGTWWYTGGLATGTGTSCFSCTYLFTSLPHNN